MAFDAFLKLDGIPGESTDTVHKGEIEVTGFQGGLSNPSHIGSATGGAGAGKATFQDFHFTAPVSQASPRLFVACALGTHIASAILSVRRTGAAKAGAQAVDFLKYTLTTCVVTCVTTGGASGDAAPDEQFTLAFAKIQLSYQPENATGGAAGAPVTGGWDLQGNKQA